MSNLACEETRPRRQISRRACAVLLEQLALTGKERRKPTQLSGGERQRVALARALVLSPDVLLLDEPLSALDPQLRQQVRVEIRDLQKKTGVTFLFVTHDQEEALSLSDTVAVMRAGRIEQMGATQELYRKPRTKISWRLFLGAINWISEIGVRPESIRITQLPMENWRSVRAVVENVTFMGPIAARCGNGVENGEPRGSGQLWAIKTGEVQPSRESRFIFSWGRRRRTWARPC